MRRSHRAPWLAVGAVCFGAFTGQLDASIVTLTFPPVARQSGAPPAKVQWVSQAYLPVSPVGLTWTLFLAGLGLGVFIPASDTAIMSAPAGAPAGALGGLVNLARGTGTALGVCIVTLALHLAQRPGGPDPRPALAMLAVAATAASLTALAGRRMEFRPVKPIMRRKVVGDSPGGRAQEGEGPGAFG